MLANGMTVWASLGQPVGPIKATNELSLFFGTLACDHNWAPLIYTDWHNVPDKDKMWEYVTVSVL